MDEVRINFDKTVKMHEACANNDLRPAMNCVYFENGYAYATNGHIAVRNKLDEICTISHEQQELLSGKMLHKNHYKDILTYDIIEVSDDGIECKHIKRNTTTFFYFQCSKLKYPSVDNTINGISSLPTVEIGKIGLEVKLLSNLCNSMHNGRYVFFSFKGVDKGIVVRSIGAGDSVGILMPRITDAV